ncbi:MAG: hypothetical protein NDI69_08495 [Bacteriovoracaceae bacterium]|nr:hypothetical protein [Bacteriovoracaceae bacterium]
MSLIKINEALEQTRLGNFAKAINLFMEVRPDEPLNMDIHRSLAKLFYLNRQYEKSIQAYLISLHLYASAHFRSTPVTTETKQEFLDRMSFSIHIGCSQLALNQNTLRPKLDHFFDIDSNLEAYRLSLINKPGKPCEEYLLFCKSIGDHLFESAINWNNLELKNTNDVRAMIRYYESMYSDENSSAA